MATFGQKVAISAQSAFLFALINFPMTYQITDRLLPGQLWNSLSPSGCPTALGFFLHTLVFLTVTYLTMSGSAINPWIKVKHSLYGTLIFFLVANPVTYSVVASVLGNWVADSNGCPTMSGIFLHAVVYLVALVAVMYLPD